MCEVLTMGLKEQDKKEAKGASNRDRKGNIKKQKRKPGLFHVLEA